MPKDFGPYNLFTDSLLDFDDWKKAALKFSLPPIRGLLLTSPDEMKSENLLYHFSDAGYCLGNKLTSKISQATIHRVHSSRGHSYFLYILELPEWLSKLYGSPMFSIVETIALDRHSDAVREDNRLRVLLEDDLFSSIRRVYPELRDDENYYSDTVWKIKNSHFGPKWEKKNLWILE